MPAPRDARVFAARPTRPISVWFCSKRISSFWPAVHLLLSSRIVLWLLLSLISFRCRCHYALLFDSAERSHWVMCAPVSACSARLKIASRTIPAGSALASSRSRVACSTSRSSKGCFWLKRCWYCGERCCRFCIALHPSNRVRRERNGLSVTDGYHGWSGDEMKVGFLCVEYKSSNAYSLSLIRGVGNLPRYASG